MYNWSICPKKSIEAEAKCMAEARRRLTRHDRTPHVTNSICICMHAMLCDNHARRRATCFVCPELHPPYKCSSSTATFPSNYTLLFPLKLSLTSYLAMANNKQLVAGIWLCLMVASAVGQLSEKRLSYRAQQCRINRLTAAQPQERIECEGGLIEMWNENEEQYQCTGIQAMRVTIQPNSLALPKFLPFPRLIYIQQGEGLMGVSFPGCPETYHSTGKQGFRGEEEERPGFTGEEDLHQKVHRFRSGDVVAIPAGTVHWCYNDGNEPIVAVIVHDLNNPSNQLDQNFRSFFLAGGLVGADQPSLRGVRGTERFQHQFQNVFAAFDPELLAEAFNVPVDLIRRMQQTQDRTLIIRVEKGQMRMLSPDMGPHDEDEEYYRRRTRYMGLDVETASNGLDETVCNMKIRHSLDTRREADFYSRQGGRLNLVNQQKLPILRYLDMSIQKGHMFPNAVETPNWDIRSHGIAYVTRGEAHVQVVGSNGQTLMDERVREGEMFVVPQYLTCTLKAGSNGFEYVVYKTSNSPMVSPVVGYTSVFRAMPLQVLTNAFQISRSEAQKLKFNRQHESFFLSPLRASQGGRF